MCENFGAEWDIKFNPLKSQLATFGGNNPSYVEISINGLSLQWVDRVRYLGIDFLCKSGRTDWSHNIRMFYSQFNNIMSVLGNGSHDDCTFAQSICFLTLIILYGGENSVLRESDNRKIGIIWNNCFRYIFSMFLMA